MLAQKSYPTQYVDTCRSWLRDHVAGYQALELDAETAAAFEPGQAQLLVLGLDHLFTHRMRGQEGTGVLRQVRDLCDAIRNGAAPAMTVAEAGALAEAFCDEIGERFPDSGSA
jgi:hypothetical protein